MTTDIGASDRRDGALVTAWRFVLVLVPTILVLGVLNALPQFVGGEPLAVVRYESIQRAEERVGATLVRPGLVPRPWVWPPAAVRFAAVKPGWVELVLEPAGGDGSGEMSLCQTLNVAAADLDVPPVLLPPGQVLQADDVRVGARTVRARRLLLADGRLVHELWWFQHGRRVMLRAQVSADTLLRMAPAILGTTR